MKIEFTPEQLDLQREVREYMQTVVTPPADTVSAGSRARDRRPGKRRDELRGGVLRLMS